MKPWIILTPVAISLLLCIYVLGCRPQFYTPATYKGKQLIFGNGGGFSGAETQYILLENGQLFTNNSLAEKPQFLKILPKNISRQLFEKALQVQLMNTAFNHPGNIYHFIGIKDKNHFQQVTWGDKNYKVPTAIEELFQLLMVSSNE